MNEDALKRIQPGSDEAGILRAFDSETSSVATSIRRMKTLGSADRPAAPILNLRHQPRDPS